MDPAASPRREGDSAPAPLGPRVLDLLTSGLSVAAIADTRNMTRLRVEKILRAELRVISIRPARDYAKLQIRRLEAMAGRLAAKAHEGDLGAVDRILRILERLDRYHGFGKLPATSPRAEERAAAAFDRKLADLVARRKRAEQEDAGRTAQPGRDPANAGAD
jgi:hypothetical protein